MTSRQAKGFLKTTKKHLDVFRDDSEFGWKVVNQDVREFFTIHTRKYNSINTIQSFACALNASDATIGLL